MKPGVVVEGAKAGIIGTCSGNDIALGPVGANAKCLLERPGCLLGYLDMLVRWRF